MRGLIVAVLLAVGLESQAVCPPDVTARLKGARLGSAAVQRFCATTQTLITRGVLLQVHHALLDAFTQALLPIAVAIPNRGDVVNLSEGVYCGPAGKHAGSFLVVATARPSVGGASHLRAADCSAGLDAIARRVAASPEAGDYALAARLRVEWWPWTLSTRVTEAEAHKPDGGRPASWAEMKRALLAGPLQSLTVDSIPVVRSSDPTRPILMAATFYFNPSSIGIVGVPRSDIAAVTNVAALPPYAALASDFQGAPGNITLRVADSAVNAAAVGYFAAGPVTIRVAAPLRDVDIDALRVTAASGSYTMDMRGRFFGDRYVGKLIMAGEPLVVTRVEIDAECAAGAATCDFKRQLAGFAADAVTQSLGATPWNPFSKDQVVPIPWGDSTVTLKGQIRQVDAISGGLLLHGDFSLMKP